MSYAAPSWAMKHPNELRHTMYWATTPPDEMRRTLLSSSVPFWATPHPNELTAPNIC
jgi:hypothetical protein